jgi:hypothetical protein
MINNGFPLHFCIFFPQKKYETTECLLESEISYLYEKNSLMYVWKFLCMNFVDKWCSYKRTNDCFHQEGHKTCRKNYGFKEVHSFHQVPVSVFFIYPYRNLGSSYRYRYRICKVQTLAVPYRKPQLFPAPKSLPKSELLGTESSWPKFSRGYRNHALVAPQRAVIRRQCVLQCHKMADALMSTGVRVE